MLSFRDFLNEHREKETGVKGNPTAGIVILWENRILLVHPTNSSWKKATCGIPKGGLDPGEDIMLGALRELREETGIELSSDQLDPELHRVDLYNQKGEPDGYLAYFVCNLNSLSQVGLESERVPTSQLQLEEVDWGKFVKAEEAYPIMTRNQLIILDRHLTLDK